MRYFVYITHNGLYKTGLSPVWESMTVAEGSGVDKTSSANTNAALSEVAGGWYTFSITRGSSPWEDITEDLVGVIDADTGDALGMADSERYIPVDITYLSTANVTATSLVGHTVQSGDSYAVVAHADYGNAKLTRADVPATTMPMAKVNNLPDDIDNDLYDVGDDVGIVLTNLATVDSVVDVIRAVTDNLPDSGALTALAAAVAAILDDTGTNGVKLADDSIKKGTFDETTAWPLLAADTGATEIARTGADGDTLEDLSDEIAAIPTVLGAGALSETITVDDGADPIDNVAVWVTTDEPGSNVVVGASYTNALGKITFQLEAEDYYVWCSHSGYNFNNPTSHTVSGSGLTISGSAAGGNGVMNFTELLTQVQTELGKANPADTELITTARCGHWINEAQRFIIYRYPGLRYVHILDKTTWTAVENAYELDLADFTTYPVAVVNKLRFVDTTNGVYNYLQPYVGGVDQWDEDYPYIPDRSSGYPTRFVRRGNKIEVDIPFSATAAGAKIWCEYARIPTTMTGTDTPALTYFDECLIAKAKAYAFGALGSKFQKVAALQHEIANHLIAERVDGEIDLERATANTYEGP